MKDSLLHVRAPASYTCGPMTFRSAAHSLLALTTLIAVVLTTAFFLPVDAEAQRKKVVFGEEEEGSVVEGYVHKPEVGYIITRQEQEDLETLQLKESFAPKIVRSVNKAPF